MPVLFIVFSRGIAGSLDLGGFNLISAEVPVYPGRYLVNETFEDGLSFA
jgi:hypothetical protein